jgi:hypothetical protein
MGVSTSGTELDTPARLGHPYPPMFLAPLASSAAATAVSSAVVIVSSHRAPQGH